MKWLQKLGSMIIAAVLCVGLCACNVITQTDDPDKDVDEVITGDYSQYTRLVIDGGGQNAAYNSTSSLIYDKYTNPYPYNTLQKLVEEWNQAHAAEYGYYFEVATSSINNNRETMVPMLNNGTAPEIIYYLPTTIAEDQNKGWFYDISQVMETPNVYSKQGEDGSVRWRDLYSDDLYQTQFSPNGQLFTVAMEQNPIGILYNKTVFEAAGITQTPVTYKQFMEAQDAINAYAKTVDRADATNDSTYLCPYFFVYPWYDSFLETSLMGDKMSVLDVIDANGVLNAEELVRGFMTKDENGDRLYSPDSDVIEELYRLIKQTGKYYPSNYGSYYATEQFVAGNLVMLEVTGGDIRELIDTVDGKFEVGVFPYPVLETQPAGEAESPYYTKFNQGNYYVQRGLSGYSTGWAITNAAMNKDAANGNDKCVGACIDILMWLSCFENNDKMVNDLGFAIPLSGNTTYSYFTNLAETFKVDRENDKALAWAAGTAGSAMNKDYYDACYLFRRDVIGMEESAIRDGLREPNGRLYTAFTGAANNLYQQNKWDRTKWPAYEATVRNS